MKFEIFETATNIYSVQLNSGSFPFNEKGEDMIEEILDYVSLNNICHKNISNRLVEIEEYLQKKFDCDLVIDLIVEDYELPSLESLMNVMEMAPAQASA